MASLEEDLEKHLANVPLGELQQARANGSHPSLPRKHFQEKFQRANKNRPVEMSAKAPVQRFREIIQAPKKVVRDPRFESLCGKLDQDGSEHLMASLEEDLEKHLANVPLGELQQARANGSHPSLPRKHFQEKFQRANKNRPVEMSTKAPVQRFREIIQAPKKVVRDPRFESLCGKLDQDGFRKRYNFLYEVELPSEKEKLKKLLKKTKDPGVTEELQSHISWIDKQIKANSGTSKNIDAKILAEHKKKEREAAKHGKRPFYLKKSEIRRRGQVQKYDELQTSGKLDSYIDKRRRRNASKDHRYMPYRRSSKSDQDS